MLQFTVPRNIFDFHFKSCRLHLCEEWYKKNCGLVKETVFFCLQRVTKEWSCAFGWDVVLLKNKDRWLYRVTCSVFIMCIVRMIVILKRTIEGEVELETSKNILSIFSIWHSLYILGRIWILLQNNTNLYKCLWGGQSFEWYE